MNEINDLYVDACAGRIRAALETPMERYLAEAPQALDALSQGLSLPLETVRGMTVQAVCRRIHELFPDADADPAALGKVVWPLAEPLLLAYDKEPPEQRRRSWMPRKEDDDPELPPPEKQPFIVFHCALTALYGEDDTLTEALFNGLIDAGCGSEIPLHRYIHIVRGMGFIPRERILYDLLVRPFLKPRPEEK